MVSNVSDKRGPNQNPTTPAILPKDSLDAQRLNPYAYIIADKPATKYLTAKPFSGAGTAFLDTQKDTEKIIQDKLELSSVVSVSYQPKYDPVTKALTYSAVLKIKNTSLSPTDTTGVEARISTS
jgi:hypothetical protein